MTALHATRSADLPPLGEAAGLVELWAWTLPLALLGSWMCFAKVPGVNWALWTAASAAGFVAVGRRSDRTAADRYPRTSLTLGCLLSLAAAVTANPHADALIFMSVAALFALSVLATATRSADPGPSALARAPLDLCRLLCAEAAARMAQTFAAARMRSAVPVVRGTLMAGALAGALFLLLSAADPTLADWRQLAWETILSRMFLARDVFFVMLAVLLLGAYGLAARTSRPLESAEAPSAPLPRPSSAVFSDVERLIVLGAALILFVVFFAVELSRQLTLSGVHLTGGETFAEAAHRGFGEMLVAAALCAVVIITLDQSAVRGARERSVRVLAWAVVAASLVIVASAYLRVRYYETAYGYTEQRLYVQVICWLVSLALLSLAWELRSAINIPRLTRHVALLAIAAVAGLSYWNNAAWIVNANVGRYERTGKLDVNYLERLARSSPDAIPALIKALPLLTGSDASLVRESLRHTSLDRSILMPPAGMGGPSWYEWSLRRAAARSALAAAGLLARPPGR